MADHRRLASNSVVAVAAFTLAVGAALYAVCMLVHWPFGAAQVAMLAFLAALTAVLHLWQENGLIEDPKGFMFRFMLGLIIKLGSSLVAIAAILLLLPRERALPLALTFAVLYLAFLAFSTVRLSARSRNAPRP
ncbi:MAG: hypothetical protein LKM36_02795 [Flavobacteriales bacterium]|jgi:FlaA1/EpsC-like NDP-sugar epimerase|nr:hypothetical protein [Flavobacteriales bacterium]